MENSERKYLKVLGLIFLGVLLVLIAVRIVREGIFTKKSGINVAVVGKDGVALLILRPDEDILGWVKLPEKLKVKIYNSGAQYPIGSLWDYGVSEKHPYEVLEKSLGLSMGVIIARTIKTNGPVSLEETLTGFSALNLKTDLSIRDRFLIRQYLVEAVASKKVLEMEVPGNAMDKVTEPDGKEFLMFNNVTALWTKNKFLLESILNENAEVSVNNISGLSGLGIGVSRQLEAAGVRVIEVKTDPGRDVPGDGCLFVSWGKYPQTEELLLDQLGCKQTQIPGQAEMRGIEIWLK